MDKRIEIKRSIYEIEGTLEEASKAFRALINEIPVEYRKTARVDYEREEEYGCTYTYVVLTYYRPETPEEEAERVKVAEDRDRERRERDQKELQRLLSVYGGPDGKK